MLAKLQISYRLVNFPDLIILTLSLKWILYVRPVVVGGWTCRWSDGVLDDEAKPA
jgi:hypothetical protein